MRLLLACSSAVAHLKSPRKVKVKVFIFSQNTHIFQQMALQALHLFSPTNISLSSTKYLKTIFKKYLIYKNFHETSSKVTS